MDSLQQTFIPVAWRVCRFDTSGNLGGWEHICRGDSSIGLVLRIYREAAVGGSSLRYTASFLCWCCTEVLR